MTAPGARRPARHRAMRPSTVARGRDPGHRGHGRQRPAGARRGHRRTAPRRRAGEIRLAGEPITAPVGLRSASGWASATSRTTGWTRGSWRRYPVSLNLVLKRIGDAPFWRRGTIDRTAIDATARELIAEFDIRTPSPRHAHRQAQRRQHPEGAAGARAVVRAARGGVQQAHPRPRRADHGVGPRADPRARGARRGRSIVISTDLDELIDLSRPRRGAVRGAHRGHRGQRPGRRDAHRRADGRAATRRRGR